MQTRPLGDTGSSVSAIGFGAMHLSLSGRPEVGEAIRVLLAALDSGVTLIDTADVYCIDDRDVGHNERLVARALAEHRGVRPLVATKGGLERPGGAWISNGRPRHLRNACEASLRALGVETIDLYQLHAPDPRVPFAESVGALAELRQAGKIRHLGLSNVTVDQIREAQTIAPVTSVQNRCLALDRAAFAGDVVTYCAAHRITYLAYSPVGGSHGKSRIATHRTLNDVGRRHGVSPFRIALAWLLRASPAIVPIPGASKIRTAVDSACAMKVALGDEDVAELTAAAGG